MELSKMGRLSVTCLTGARAFRGLAMHDVMFQEQGRLSVKELKEKAGRLGLDQRKFEACRGAGRHTERVQEDMKEGRPGRRDGHAGAVNGAVAKGGPVSLETVSNAIERELERAKR